MYVVTTGIQYRSNVGFHGNRLKTFPNEKIKRNRETDDMSRCRSSSWQQISGGLAFREVTELHKSTARWIKVNVDKHYMIIRLHNVGVA